MLFPTLGNKNQSTRSYVICLKMPTKLLIACNFLSHMDSNRDVGAGFTISSIKSIDVLVAAYWLDIPDILLCLGGYSAVFCAFVGCHCEASILVCENLTFYVRYFHACKLQVINLSSFVDLCFLWILFTYGFFLPHIFLTCYMCPFSVATLLGIYLSTRCLVIPDHYWEYHFWISLIHVDLTGMSAAAWRYLIKSVWFVMLYALLILCSISLSIFGLLFSKGTLHNPVNLSLFLVNIVFIIYDVDVCVCENFF